MRDGSVHDAIIGVGQKGRIALNFVREGRSTIDSIYSAISDIKNFVYVIDRSMSASTLRILNHQLQIDTTKKPTLNLAVAKKRRPWFVGLWANTNDPVDRAYRPQSV